MSAGNHEDSSRRRWWQKPGVLPLARVFVVLVCLSLDASTRVALYIAPLWFALLTIGYRLYAVKPEQRQSLAQAQQKAA